MNKKILLIPFLLVIFSSPAVSANWNDADNTFAGTQTFSSLKMSSSPGAGYVLVSSNVGLGTWMAATTLPVVPGTTPWGGLTGTMADQADLQNALDAKVDENGAITGATKTKITYDTKGLVTAGADATTADIADSANKRYVTDAQLTVIGNTSGTNTGDQTNVAGNAATVTFADSGADTTTWVALGAAQTGNQGVSTDAGLTYNANTDALTATTFIGALTGNSSTTTKLAATKTINGTAFDGSANITVTADASTLTNTTLNSGVVTSSLTSVGTLTSLATSGNVGVGTATAPNKLYVAGTAELQGIQLRGNGVAAGNFLQTDASGVGTWVSPVGNVGVGTILTGTAGTFPYYASGGITLTASIAAGLQTNGTNVGIGTSQFNSRLAIIGGNVGIGTVNPNGLLQVRGNVGVGTATAAAAGAGLMTLGNQNAGSALVLCIQTNGNLGKCTSLTANSGVCGTCTTITQ